MTLWTPGTDRALESRQLRAAAIRASVELHDKLARWNHELQAIDHHLQLVKAREDSTLPELKPGYYHVIRSTPGAPPTVIVHEGPNGEFREPDSGLFEGLKRGDMWNDRSVAERKRRTRELEKRKLSAEAAERAERREEIWDRYRHRHVVKAAFPRGIVGP